MRRRLARRAASFGDFDDGVGEGWGFDFGGAPAEFNFHRNVFAGEVFLCDFDEFGGDDFAGEVFGALPGGAFGDGEDPADATAALLGVDEAGDGFDVEAALDNPVDAGEASVENAVVDVAGHFLGADEHALDVGVVDVGEVGAAVGVDVPAGALEEGDGGVLQAAFRDAKAEFVGHAATPAPAVRGRVKQLTVPS